VPFGPINDLAAVFDDTHVRSRGLRVEAPHSTCGRVPMVASPIRLSGTPIRNDVPPPTLGQHTREVLVEVLGMEDSEVEALRGRRIV
jgi:crotonobetainyl-CoA:carnitine CoA-transferase CaiB-like acyl-CoA transferase